MSMLLYMHIRTGAANQKISIEAIAEFLIYEFLKINESPKIACSTCKCSNRNNEEDCALPIVMLNLQV